METENDSTPNLDRPNLEQQILDFVGSDGYRPAKPRVITQRMGLDQNRLVEVRRLIKRMVRAGKLSFGAKHLVLPATSGDIKRSNDRKTESRRDSDRRSARPNEIQGTFRKTNQPFGFVTPEDYFGNDRAQDIFIPPRKALDASDGDKVLVRLSRSQRPGDDRRSGSVVKVISRKTVRFVGTYRERAGEGYVFIDNEQFEAPVLVGDASARNGRVGDKVVVEIVHFPVGREAGEAVIVEVLGPRGTPGVDTQTVINEFGLPRDFPHDAIDEAHRQAEAFDENALDGRTDFTTKTVITIDPATARDFDDAISLDRLDNGHWQLGVHIADVSHFVRRGTPLDDEAYERATSVYLPDKVIPMLPEVISNNLASLQPHRRRYTMSVLIEMTDEGIVIDSEWHRGVICSQHRFNYEEIDDYLANDGPWQSRLEPDVFRLVRDMHTLAMTIRRRRMKQGSIDLALRDVAIDLDEDGKVSGAHVEENTESHQVIEEFMLAANEAVATRLNDMELFYLRRIHESPNEKKLFDLTDFVRHLGIECDSMQSRFEIKRVIELANDLPEKQAINFAILRSMQKAVYSPKEVGHYALNSDNYCHFTSPIRRYPDLIIHRMVGDLIDGKKPMSDFGKLERLGQHCSEREQRAEQAERELIKLKLLNFLSDKIGQQMEAFVTGVESFGLFVQGVELPAEGLLPLEQLPNDQYWFDGTTRTLQGRREGNQFQLGDRMTVAVKHVDPDRRQLEFEFVSSQGTKRPPRSAPRTSINGKRKRSSSPKRGSNERTSRKGNKGKRKRR
ncbi:MAG: ribonuclease R [Pirellulaceae bacterium]